MAAPTAMGTRTRFGWGPLILLGGHLVIPFALAIGFNSYGPPDDAAYVRMAFATVAGCTIGILSSVVAVVVTFRHAQRRMVRTLVGLGAGLLAMQSIGSLSIASQQLLQRLGLG